MHGVINLLKPPGMTSHDAVPFVRRELKIKRVAQTGTLDPAAAGVLPLCVGQATRLVEYLQAGTKTYIAEATFGMETDTLDGVGQVMHESDASQVNFEAIHAALDNFRGDIEQIPPIYSAMKREGQKLYDLARAGQLDESELAPRRVTIHRVFPTRFVEGQRPRAMIHIECSGGTYIRSLVRDLGRALGCGATMTFLVRTRSGGFTLQDAVTLEEIAANPASALLPIETALRYCGMLMVTEDKAVHELSQGKRVRAADLLSAVDGLQQDGEWSQLILVNKSGTIAAIAVPENDANGVCYKPEKVLFLN
jgi:tRNA pseudouridine55 synthase